MISAPFTTGILATVGPSLETRSDFKAAILAGASNFRFHLGHPDRDHAGDVLRLREAAAELDKEVTVLFDLPSNRPRTGQMEEMTIRVGDELVLGRPGVSDSRLVPISGLSLFAPHLKVGSTITLADMKIVFTVRSLEDNRVVVSVSSLDEPSVQLKSNTGILVPGTNISFDPVTESDLEILRKAEARGCLPDWVAISFVNDTSQVEHARSVLRRALETWKPRVMAKIETRRGLEAIAEISTSADGIMVARGDLIADLEPAEMPYAQEIIVEAARSRNKVSVVATQMLERFSETGKVYRAELTDIACAVRQRATAIMLGKETCFSDRPAEVVKLAFSVIERYSTRVGEEDMLNFPQSFANPKRKPYTIVAIEGPNGVGKTTLGRLLAQESGWEYCLGVPGEFMEMEMKNRMLFHADWQASALYFLAGAIELNRELSAIPAGSVVVMDRSPWSTAAVHVATNPERADWIMKALDLAADRLPMPDYVLILEASYDACRSRIAKKPGRESFFDRDSEAYFRKEREFYRQLRVFLPTARIIDTDNLDEEGMLNAAHALLRDMMSQKHR